MKCLATSLTFLLALAACGDNPLDAPIDSPTLPATCDTIAQDCPTGFKCSVTATDHKCVSILGTVPEGSVCSRTGLNDDCALGLVCSSSGTCRRLCTEGAASCAAGQRCIHHRTAEDGVCEDPCTLLDSTTCPAELSCDIGFEVGAGLAEYCRRFDSTPLGAACIPEVQCGQNATCGNPDANVCTPLCDATHACVTGTCQFPLPEVPTLGVCF